MRKLVMLSLVGLVLVMIGVPAATGAAPEGRQPLITCGTPTGHNYTAPTIGASASYPASSAGTVTIKRTSATNLAVTHVAPASGYHDRVAVAAGAKVRVTFVSATQTVRFAAHLSATGSKLHTTVTVCT